MLGELYKHLYILWFGNNTTVYVLWQSLRSVNPDHAIINMRGVNQNTYCIIAMQIYKELVQTSLSCQYQCTAKNLVQDILFAFVSILG